MIHFKSWPFFATVLGIFSSSIQATITSVPSMTDAQSKIREVLQTHKPQDILVAFDIDMTLLQFDHAAVYYLALKKYSDIYKGILGKASNLDKDIVNTQLVHRVSLKLVEDNAPAIVSGIQDLGVKTIAFTATLTGPMLKSNQSTIDLRGEQLQKNGFDFSKSFYGMIDSLIFTDFSEYARSYPMFKRGILASNGEGSVTKGPVFVAFLIAIGPEYQRKTGNKGFVPKVVIMIDDRKKNLIDIEENLKSYDPSIEFIGIEYQGAFTYAPEDICESDFKKFWEDFVTTAKMQIY